MVSILGRKKQLFTKKEKMQIARKEIMELISADISFEIQAAFMEVIDSFYASYTPVAYQRTEATYMASSNYDDSTKFTWEGRHTVSGIQVDAANIEPRYGGQPYYNHWGKNKGRPMNTEWVFERTFSEGIHGVNKADYRRFQKSEYSRNKQNSYRLLKKAYEKNGKKLSRYRRPKFFMEKYFKSYLIDNHWATVKSPMSPLQPSPKKRMKDRYNAFINNGKIRSNGRTLQEISTQVISAYLTQHPDMIFKG